MDFYRANENDKKSIKYKKSISHNTALIAKEVAKVVGVLEYEINNIVDAEIINIKSYDLEHENEILKGFIDEIMYWNPYIKRISYNEDNAMITHEALEYCLFSKRGIWVLNSGSNIDVFKIGIDKITPEQLTVDREKIQRVGSWIEKPEDIVVTCVKIDDKVVTIDGYSRLIVALNKGFNYVYAHFEPDNTSTKFYKTCMGWCQEEGVYTIKDLSTRVVSPEEHQRLWVNRCQEYIKRQRDKVL